MTELSANLGFLPPATMATRLVRYSISATARLPTYTPLHLCTSLSCCTSLNFCTLVHLHYFLHLCTSKRL